MSLGYKKYLTVQTETVSTIYIIDKKDTAFDILQAVTINNKFRHASLDIWDTHMAIVYCYIHHAFHLYRLSGALGNHNIKYVDFFYRYQNPRC